MKTMTEPHYLPTLNDGKHIFVFGSNLAGNHGKGAAAEALYFWGAKYGHGHGPFGKSYAIPTKNANLRTLPLDWIANYVKMFLFYARQNPDLIFLVTRVGCGLANLKDEQMAPMFKDAPPNCVLPAAWKLYNDLPPPF